MSKAFQGTESEADLRKKFQRFPPDQNYITPVVCGGCQDELHAKSRTA